MKTEICRSQYQVQNPQKNRLKAWHNSAPDIARGKLTPLLSPGCKPEAEPCMITTRSYFLQRKTRREIVQWITHYSNYKIIANKINIPAAGLQPARFIPNLITLSDAQGCVAPGLQPEETQQKYSSWMNRDLYGWLSVFSLTDLCLFPVFGTNWKGLNVNSTDSNESELDCDM